MIMDQAPRQTPYARRKEFYWSRTHVCQEKPRVTCASISRWAALRSKRALSTAMCRTLLFVVALMTLTSVVFSPSGPPNEVHVRGGVENVAMLQSALTLGSARSTGVNDSRLQELDSRLVTTNKSTPADKSQPTTVSLGPASVFAHSYAPQYAHNDSDFLGQIRIISRKKWVFNSSNAKAFRNKLRAALGKQGSLENFITTRRNTLPGQNVSFYLHGSMRMSKTFWKWLPRGPLYKRGVYRTCSVVGSSGVLRGSRCGKLIDKAKLVIRFNLAYVKGYEADVGHRTHFTTLNPSLVYRRFNGLKNDTDDSDFRKVLQQFKGSCLWLPGFAATRTHRTLVRVATAARTSKLATPIFGHPEHYTAVANLWKETLNTTSWTTTGLHVLTSIFDMCSRIEVFGFWPFAVSLDGRDVPYHYHDGTIGASSHSFIKEFKALLHLHELGIIRFHLGRCS